MRKGEFGMRVDEEIEKEPFKPGAESKSAYAERIAALVGCSKGVVFYRLMICQCQEVGDRVRRVEAAKKSAQIETFSEALGPIRDFRDWVTVFRKFRAVAEAYGDFAVGRGDVYAQSFLEEISTLCDRAIHRARRSSCG